MRKIAFFLVLLAFFCVNSTLNVNSASSVWAANPALTTQESPTPVTLPSPEPALQVSKTTEAKVEVADASTDGTKRDKPEVASEKKAPAVISSEHYLPPESTRAWMSFRDVDALKNKIAESDLGILCVQESVAPFIDSIREQLKGILKKNNIQFGIELDSLNAIETGEICIAGILPEVAGKKPQRGSHGVVVLVDVSQDTAGAIDLIAKASEKMVERGAVREKMPINGTDVEKLVFELKNARPGKKRQSFATVVNGRLLASDNEVIFRDVLRRLKSPTPPQPSEHFGGQKSFRAISARTATEGYTSDIKWFVDPFGYAKLADALAEENRPIKQMKSGVIEKLETAGLDAIKAAGGSFAFGTSEHEVLYRAMIYGPQSEAKTESQRRIFKLLDFTEMPGQTAIPPTWVAEDASSYFTAAWDVQTAFQNIGHFVDSIAGEEGSWSSILEKMKTVPKFRVDLAGMVAKLDNRITIMSLAEEPITPESEKVVIGVKLKDELTKEEQDWLIESIGRAVQGKVKVLGGYKTIEDDPTQIEDDEMGPDLDDLNLEGEGFGDEEELEPEADMTILNRRYFAIKHGHLLIANDKDYLKRLLLKKETDLGSFAKKSDLVRVQEELAKMTNEKRIRFRQFGRLDRILKPNYEMLRRGEMATSQTMFARVLNKIMSEDEEEPEKRKQQIDGSKLPEDYEAEVAPYLGTAGWVMEIQEDGWLFTGCVLKKEKTKKKEAVAEAEKK